LTFESIEVITSIDSINGEIQMIVRNDIPVGYTHDRNGRILTFKDSKGHWNERTYDKNGNLLTYKNSDGFWSECTYDEHGKRLTFKNSESK
jgi:YD repeat-containing protein